MPLPEGRWPSEDPLPKPWCPQSRHPPLELYPSLVHESGARPSTHRPLPQQARSQSFSRTAFAVRDRRGDKIQPASHQLQEPPGAVALVPSPAHVPCLPGIGAQPPPHTCHSGVPRQACGTRARKSGAFSSVPVPLPHCPWAAFLKVPGPPGAETQLLPSGGKSLGSKALGWGLHRRAALPALSRGNLGVGRVAVSGAQPDSRTD